MPNENMARSPPAGVLKRIRHNPELGMSAESDDGVSSADGPEHARLFESADKGFTSVTLLNA